MKETVEVMRHLNALEIITTWVGDKINFLVNPIGVYFLLLAVFFLFISGLNLKTNIDRSIFLILGILLSVVFFTTSVLVFIIAFEGLTAGLAFMIWTNGASARKNLAAGKMIAYSLTSTIPFFFLLWIMINKHIPLTWEEANKNTQIWMLAFFLAMGTKLAVPPMHSWLPEAHVEAPTGGSMLLASTMLKVGGYGLLLGIPDSLTPIATAALIIWGVVGSTIASIAVIRQTDLKKIIAYSSSAHLP
jgi:NADH-quinone oxidoreductase subunit M